MQGELGNCGRLMPYGRDSQTCRVFKIAIVLFIRCSNNLEVFISNNVVAVGKTKWAPCTLFWFWFNSTYNPPMYKVYKSVVFSIFRIVPLSPQY